MNRFFRSDAEAQGERQEASWGHLCWLAGEEWGNADGLTLGRVLIRRGCSNPRHCHPSCEEALTLLRGRLRHTLGEQSFELGPGDTLSIPAGAFHNAESIGDEDADMIVVYSEARREFVLESEHLAKEEGDARRVQP